SLPRFGGARLERDRRAARGPAARLHRRLDERPGEHVRPGCRRRLRARGRAAECDRARGEDPEPSRHRGSDTACDAIPRALHLETGREGFHMQRSLSGWPAALLAAALGSVLALALAEVTLRVLGISFPLLNATDPCC